MDRRQCLASVAGAVAGLAGCGARPPSQGGGDPTQTERTRTDSTRTESAQTIGVGIATSRYLVRSFAQTPEQRAIDREQITPAAEVPDPLRGALRAARTGGYRTDEASRDLLAAVDRFRHNGGGYRFEPYVRLDGTPYAFDPTVPAFTAHLDTGVEDPPPARTVGPGDLDGLAEPVRAFVRTIGAFTVEVPRDEYRISVVPDDVDAFLDRYDYVRDPEDAGRIVTERVDPGPPYTISLRELTTEDLWGRPVVAAESLPVDLQRFVEDVVASDRRAPAQAPLRSEFRTDALPESYRDRLGPKAGPGSGPYVDLGGTPHAFRATEIHRDRIPVAVAAEPADRRSFTVRVGPSEADSKPAVAGPVEFRSAGALPSVLWIETGTERYLLDSDAYEAVRWSEGESGDVDRRIENVARASVAPGETLEATYAVPEAVPPGQYRAWGSVEVQWTEAGDDRRSPVRPYPFRVVVTVPEGSTTEPRRTRVEPQDVRTS